MQTGQAIDLNSGLLREYSDESQSKKSKLTSSNLESVKKKKKFFKGKFFNLVDPLPSETKVKIEDLTSIEEL